MWCDGLPIGVESTVVLVEADGPELFRVLLYELAVVFGPLVAGGIVGDEIDVVLTHVFTFRCCPRSCVFAEPEPILVYLFVRGLPFCVSQCDHMCVGVSRRFLTLCIAWMTKGALVNHIVGRFACFACGVVVNSFAIALITKGDLGTSQISSVPYVLSLRFPLSFGMMTFIMNMGFIVLQIMLLRRDFHSVQLLQIVVNMLFSAMIDVSMSLLSFLAPTMLWQRLLCVAAGCCVMGFGIVIEVSPNVLMVPGEGIVRALSIVAHAKYGTTKIVFDVTLIAVAVVLSFAFFGTLRGVGLGTIVSALCVGSIINVINRTFSFPERIRSLELVTDRNVSQG